MIILLLLYKVIILENYHRISKKLLLLNKIIKDVYILEQFTIIFFINTCITLEYNSRLYFFKITKKLTLLWRPLSNFFLNVKTFKKVKNIANLFQLKTIMQVIVKYHPRISRAGLI